MIYGKGFAILDIAFGLLYIGFAICFILCSFISLVDAEGWRHFICGAAATMDFILGGSHIIDGIKTLIKIKKNKSNRGPEDYDIYE